MTSRKAKRRPKARREAESTPGQLMYSEVTEGERVITELLDDIPYATLGGTRRTWNLLNVANEHLTGAIIALRKVRAIEAPRYNRSAIATEVPEKAVQP
jgi:hypothetical protein